MSRHFQFDLPSFLLSLSVSLDTYAFFVLYFLLLALSLKTLPPPSALMDYLKRVGVRILCYTYLKIEPLLNTAYPTFPKLAAGSILFLLTACFITGAFHGGHHSAFLPVVSYVGNFYPAGLFFGILITLVGNFFQIVVILRYEQLRAIISDPFIENMVPNQFHLAQLLRVPPRRTKSWLYFWNLVALFTGFVIALSFMATGGVRFLETTEWHRLVAAPILILTPIYMALQVLFTSAFLGPVNSLRTYYYRFAVWAFHVVALIGFTKSFAMCTSTYPNTFLHPVARLNWSIDQPGYWWHLSGCAFEWAFLASMVPFLLSLVPEFSCLSFVGMRYVYVFETSSTAGLLVALLAEEGHSE